MNTTKQSFIKKNLLGALGLFLLAPFCLLGQVTPEAGAVECFLVGEDGGYVDIGGPGGDDSVDNAPGNYPNCNCVTTTTLCGIDDSPVTVEFTAFGMFAEFDWMVILDAPNLLEEVYPSSILTNPDNVNLQLFNNADGVGDGGSENYGPGAEVGIGYLPNLPTTTFTATNPSGCLTFVFRASAVVDDSGWEALISLPTGAPHPGDDLSCGSSITCLPPVNLEISDLTSSSGTVNWDLSDSSEDYILEYGLQGFPLGTGTMVSVTGNQLDLTGLDEDTCYDVYVTTVCPDEMSIPAGPLTFCTPINCPPIDLASLTVSNITASTATVSWAAADSSDTYMVEYGPEGFDPGNGTQITVGATTALLNGLDEITCYDVYVTAVCVGDESMAIGPITFCTGFINPPDICLYRLDLYDSFGDGWNGSTLTVTINNISTVYTLDNINDDGIFASFMFEVYDGLPVELDYFPGAFQGEVSYQMFDPDGMLLFEDGPNPSVGIVYDEVAECPDCPAINPNTLQILDVTETIVEMIWNPVAAAVDYTIEYGPSGFPQGFGLMQVVSTSAAQITGLNPCVEYDFYITVNCGPDAGSSNTYGPVTVTTLPEFVGDPCIYTIEMFDSFGDGWNGSSIEVSTNGNTASYTFTSGFGATFDVTGYGDVPITFSYFPGLYEGEVSFNIIDPDGNIIYSDGPNPQTGEILTVVACPTCPGPNFLELLDVNADNAIIGWDASQASGTYFIEYGPLGFTVGTGTVLTGTDISQATLTGLEEMTYYDVYVRFICDNGDLSKRIGPLTFKTIWLIDVGISGVLSPLADECNLGSEEITVFIQNYGQFPQSLIPYFYAVNGVPAPVNFPTDGFFTGVVGNDSMDIASFDLEYDFSAPGYYLIEIWTELEGDSDISNDTFRYELITSYPLPLQEDFEEQVFPEGWVSDEFNPIYLPNAHNNPTTVIADNVYAGDQLFEVTTLRYGPVGDNDSLFFDYRYVNWSAGTVATNLNGDSLQVQISDDCGETYETIFTIDQNNHIPSVDLATVYIELDDYAGTAINVRFLATWASGDYWIDIDNINITGCPNTLLISGNVSQASGQDVPDGAITATPGLGVGPYTYSWDTGSEEQTISELLPGLYSVTVTDANGCTDVQSFIVSVATSAVDLPFVESIILAPNPTSGEVLLEARLNTTSETQLIVYNAVGLEVYRTQIQPGIDLSHRFDLSDQAPGMYFVRLQSEGRMHVEKLVLAGQ